MAFPTSIISYTTKVDGVDFPSAAHINSLQTEVVALETKVGIDNSADTTSLDFLLKALYPIGTVYTNYSNATNPGTLLGFGTWVAIEGEVVVGYKAGDADFGTPSGAVGAKTSAHTHAGVDHLHGVSIQSGETSQSYSGGGTGSGTRAAHSHLVSGSTGAADRSLTSGSTASSTIQPGRICYCWRRSA